MANALEHELSYPLGETLPASGRTLEVAPGVRWLRMPLPFALDHINLWLLRDEIDGRAGWTLVDCGIASDATRAAWEQVFEHELEGLPLLRVIVTHMHPDHVGLADWLTRRFDAPAQPCRLWMSATDWNTARAATRATTGVGGEAAAAFFAEHGVADPDDLERVRQRGNYYAQMVPAVPERFRRLMDAQTLRIGAHDWTCVAGYGHAPEHISLYGPMLGVLISGDMVLPRISTNMSVHDMEPEGDPLALYLASIRAMRSLDGNVLVLPSHGRPFRGLPTRIDQLLAHHEERLAEVLAACTGAPLTAMQVLPVLFKRALDLHQTTFALGETIAHLNHLWHRGELRRQRGHDGRIRFETVRP